MKRFVLFCAGLLPFLLGGAVNWMVWNIEAYLPPILLCNILTLALWAAIGYAAVKLDVSRKACMFWLHIPATVMLALLAVQELLLQGYWSNFIGQWSQFFYLPLLSLAFRLTEWSSSMIVTYVAAYLLMLTAVYIGCRLRRQGKK